MDTKEISPEYIEWQKTSGGCNYLHDLFFDSSPDAVLIFDASFSVIHVNKKVSDLFGYPVQNMLGKKPVDIFTPRSFVYFERYYEKSIGQQIEIEREIQVKYGKIVDVLSTETPIMSENKLFKGLIVHLRDITEKKRSDEMLHLESSALEATAIGIAITNNRGDIVWVNSAFKKLTGYEEEELLYKNMRILKSGKQDEYFYADMWSKILKGEIWHGELLNKRKDGQLYSEEQTITPVKDKNENITNFIVTKVNISKRKKMEEELLQMNEHLEQLVKKRTDQLAESEKMAALGQLVAGVAHEINNPIGIGYTAATYLKDQTEMLSSLYKNEQLKKSDLTYYIEQISRLSSSLVINLNRAADLIRSFKQLAVDQSTEEKRTFYVKNYLEDTITSLNPQLVNTKHIVTLSCPESLQITSYPGVYSQILTNLIINSLTHGFEDITAGIITIDVAAIDENLLISYFDNGKGIPKKSIKKIFDPFFSTKFGRGGSGLGLNIIYNLVKGKLGGEIYCHSELNKGVHFTISVPLN